MSEEQNTIDGDKFKDVFSSKDPYRIEHWYDNIRDYTFETIFLDVDAATCNAMAKYTEGVRQWRQCVNFQDTLEERMNVRESAAKALPCSPENMNLLKNLEKRLDEAIASFGDVGAFVKLSSRSPKDTCVQMHSMRVMIADEMKETQKIIGREMNETEWHCSGVSAYVDASCKVLRVHSGKEAMYLMLYSDRVYSDITRMELANAGDAKIQVAVRRWDPRVVPALEFRAFVFGHTMTACTQYYKLVYDPNLAAHSKEISDLIRNYHDEHLKPLIPLADYTVDFAVTADFKECICVELNNLPPAAGTALFDWNNPQDRAVIEHGPYEFRCNTSFHEESFGTIIEPLRLFIDSLHVASPEDTHGGISCDCCGQGMAKLTPDINPALCGIHGTRYRCKDCICYLDICSACWEAGWGLRHVNQSKSEFYPEGHKFDKYTSPIAPPEDAGIPPNGPKSVVPPKQNSGSKKKGKDKEKDKDCIVQ